MGKHYVEKREKNKTLPKIISIIIILFILVGLIYGIIAIIKNNKYQNEDAPSKTIEQAFTALKDGNLKEVNKYIDYQELIKSIDENIATNGKSQMSDLEKQFFNSLSWNIESIKVDDKKAIAIVEVTNKDFNEIIMNWIKEEIAQASNNEEVSDSSSMERLKNCAASPTIRTKTIIKKITLKKDEQNWTILTDDNLVNAIFPGLDNVNKALTQID